MSEFIVVENKYILNPTDLKSSICLTFIIKICEAKMLSLGWIVYFISLFHY